LKRLGSHKTCETDAEWGDRLIALGQEKQARAEKYRQEGKFNLYSARGRALNSDGAWLIQQGLALKKRQEDHDGR